VALTIVDLFKNESYPLEASIVFTTSLLVLLNPLRFRCRKTKWVKDATNRADNSVGVRSTSWARH